MSSSDGQFVSAQGFEIAVTRDRFSVLLRGVPYFDLSVRSSVNLFRGAEDRDQELLSFSARPQEPRPRFEWTTRSNLWEKKVYSLEIYEHAFAYRVMVTGRGRLGPVQHFDGAGQTPFSPNRYEVGRYLVPAPGGGEQTLPLYHSIAQEARVSLHYLCPPLLALPFTLGSEEAPWLALGLAARPGEWNFDHFAYHHHPPTRNSGRCTFSTDYLGYTQADGELEVASLIGTVGEDEFAALDAHAAWLYEHGGCARRDWSGSPRWWYGPFFCGWGEQSCYSATGPLDGATQAAYTDMAQRLEEAGLSPTAIIIDDKWQSAYGLALPDPQKWPNLRAFTDEQHARGRRVMLWFKAWNTEGLPVEETINLWSQPCGADPEAPAYQARLREALRRLLSDEPGCFNCDGFKVDFANVMPLGPDLSGAGTACGIELLKRWFTLFYAAAKAVKPDCLVNCSSAHPYFAETTDQCRLHDYSGAHRSAWRVMSCRRRLFQAAMPGAPVDTDAVGSSRRETLDYFRRAPELGVPDLYFLTRAGELDLGAEEFALLRETWEAYSARMDREHGPVEPINPVR